MENENEWGKLLIEFIQSNAPLAVAIRKAISEGKMPETASLSEKWHDVTDVMNMLHIGERTLLTLRTNGTLPSSKLGGKVFFKVSDIDAVLENNYQMSRLRNKDGYGSCRK